MADPIIPVKARPLKAVVLSLEGNDFGAHVSNVAQVPTTQQLTWQGMKPEAALTASSAPTWVTTLNVVQDYQNPQSLFNYLLANAGKVATLKFYPDDDGEFYTETEVTLVAPQIGGAVNAYNESTVSLGCTPPVPHFPTGTTPTPPDDDPSTPADQV